MVTTSNRSGGQVPRQPTLPQRPALPGKRAKTPEQKLYGTAFHAKPVVTGGK